MLVIKFEFYLKIKLNRSIYKMLKLDVEKLNFNFERSAEGLSLVLCFHIHCIARDAAGVKFFLLSTSRQSNVAIFTPPLSPRIAVGWI